MFNQGVTPSDLDGLHCGSASAHDVAALPHVTPSDLDGLHCGADKIRALPLLSKSPRPIWTGSIAATRR